MSAFSNYLQQLNKYISDKGDRSALESSISNLREMEFKEPDLSPLASFYKNTSQDYEKKALEAQKELSMFESIWQARYQRATQMQEQLKNAQAKEKMYAGLTGIQAYENWYDGNKGKNTQISLSQLGSSEGTLKERLERISKQRGRRNKFTQEAEKTLMLQADYEDFKTSFEKYKSQYESELMASSKANEEARKKFYEDKQKMLDLAQKAGGYDYRGATYVEKPL